MWTRTSTSSRPRNPAWPRRSSVSSRSVSRLVRRRTSRAPTASVRTFAHGGLRSRTRKMACAGGVSAVDRLSCRRVVVAARDAGHVLSKQHELHGVLIDPLLAVDVVWRTEPGHMRTWSELLLIEDADRAVGHQLPMRVAVAAANHVSDPPRLVIVHWCGRVRREAGEHQGEAIRIGLQ